MPRPVPRRRLLAGLAVVAPMLTPSTLALLAAARPARAATRAPYDPAQFAAAQARGGPVLVEVTAPWCPTCRAQRPHVEAALADPLLRDAVLFTVDFDTQKDALRQFRVRLQSTLIAFHGREERGRATGITDGEAIRALLLRAA